MRQLRRIFTLPNANHNYTLANRMADAGLSGSMFASLSYFAPGSDYTTPNTDNVAVGDTSMADEEDGLLIPPGIRWDDPAARPGTFYDATTIAFRSATAGQRIMVIGIVL